VRPSALAVLRLITSSNLVGCCTGRSAASAPLRICASCQRIRKAGCIRHASIRARTALQLISWSGTIMGTATSGYAPSVLGTSSALANCVDAMLDSDIACPDQAQALTLKVIPGTAPLLVIHYRTPIASTWQFGPSGGSPPDYRYFATLHQTGVVVSRVRAMGMIGTISSTPGLALTTSSVPAGFHCSSRCSPRQGRAPGDLPAWKDS
jgi:hypothetical protein